MEADNQKYPDITLTVTLRELAIIVSSLSWDRKTHGVVLSCDSDFWWYRFKWWVCGVLWGKESDDVYLIKSNLECDLAKLFQRAKQDRVCRK